MYIAGAWGLAPLCRAQSEKPGCALTKGGQGLVQGSEQCTTPLRVTIKPDPPLRLPRGCSLSAPSAPSVGPEASRPAGVRLLLEWPPAHPSWDRGAGALGLPSKGPLCERSRGGALEGVWAGAGPRDGFRGRDVVLQGQAGLGDEGSDTPPPAVSAPPGRRAGPCSPSHSLHVVGSVATAGSQEVTTGPAGLSLSHLQECQRHPLPVAKLLLGLRAWLPWRLLWTEKQVPAWHIQGHQVWGGWEARSGQHE